MLLDGHILISTHVQIGILHSALKQRKRHHFSVIGRGNDQIGWVKGDAFDGIADLKDLSLEEFVQGKSVK